MGWFGPQSGACGCCECTVAPTCTISGSVSGSDVTISWTVSGVAITSAVIVDNDGTTWTLTVPPTSGSFLVSGGKCKRYTLTVTNDCGSSTCYWVSPSCGDTNCANCLTGTAPATLTVTFTNNGVLDDCDCGNAADWCARYDGSFTVSRGSGCEWNGGPFGDAIFCEINRPAFSIKLKIKQGDCNGNNTDRFYGEVSISYAVVDPPDCIEFDTFEKELTQDLDIFDCADVLTGTYTHCDNTTQTIVCDITCEVS